jgi:L-malate glycosyltransferase
MRIVIAGPVDLTAVTAGAARAAKGAGVAHPIPTELALALRDRGHDVAVVGLSPDPEDVGTYLDGVVPTFVGTYRSRLRWPDAFRVERREVARGIRFFEPDIVHAFWTYEFALPAIRNGPAHLITIQDWGPQILRHHPHPYRVVRLGMQVATLVRAKHLTANSPYIAERVHRRYRRKIPVIPNGVRFPGRTPTRVAFDATAPRIGSINHGFRGRKNVAVLIEAFRMLRTTRPGATLRLVGDGHGPGEDAEMFARQRGALDGIEFVGRIPSTEVPAFLSDIDVLVHPSLEESFGMTLLEAIAAGVLVIAGRDSGAVPWVLDDGRAGRLVDVQRSEAVVEGLIDLPHDGPAQQARREAAFASAHSRFSLDSVLDSYEALYREVVS